MGWVGLGWVEFSAQNLPAFSINSFGVTGSWPDNRIGEARPTRPRQDLAEPDRTGTHDQTRQEQTRAFAFFFFLACGKGVSGGVTREGGSGMAVMVRALREGAAGGSCQRLPVVSYGTEE